MAEEKKVVKEEKKAKAPKEHVAKVEVKKIAKGKNTVLKLADGKKVPKFTLVKKNSEYTVFKKRNGRYSVKDKNDNWVNGDQKVKVLMAQGLIKHLVKKAA